jgi:RNA polymerase sigma-70 factor, ECF subfamily
MRLPSRRLDRELAIEPIVEGFDGFYAREYRAILALALALTTDRSQAEDLTQEAFVAALAAWGRIEDPGVWIRVVLTNKSRSWWRRQYAGKRALTRLTGSEEISTDAYEAESFWAEVRHLPRRQAQAIALFYLEDRPVSEIAHVLDCAESTVRTHLMRGRETLATRLGVDQ